MLSTKYPLISGWKGYGCKMSSFGKCLNIGAKTADKMQAAGIDSADELKRIGSKDAFALLFQYDPGA